MKEINHMINVKRLRCFIGWLAILLPWIVALLLWRIPQSISSTYYTFEAGPVFMIILGAASILLMYYDGYDKTDDILNTITGVLGLCICLFSCEPEVLDLAYVGTFQIPMLVSKWIHNIVAILFFVSLAYISFFQFTKSSGEMTDQKKIRNIIYRVCGIGMLASFLILLLPKFYIQVWLTETFALFFFGISWLTKSEAYHWLAADPKGVK
jgi:hypothetical protein